MLRKFLVELTIFLSTIMACLIILTVMISLLILAYRLLTYSLGY